ncbi:acyl carrier protein, partial [Nocardia amikacinitolerans]|uniref:acyl carrier protein n=1 Tax=Nocardia amikacinitolerans TaxID=756689 RepID=UPI001471167F
TTENQQVQRPSLAQQLLQVIPEQRHGLLLEMVRKHIAEQLHHASSADVKPNRPLQELGFDSLAALQFRNRLNKVTGLQLPTTIVFDHPTPFALAEHLLAMLAPPAPELGPAMLAQLGNLETDLLAIPRTSPYYTRAADRLRRVLRKLSQPDNSDAEDSSSPSPGLDAATDSELLDALNAELRIRK